MIMEEVKITGMNVPGRTALSNVPVSNGIGTKEAYLTAQET